MARVAAQEILRGSQKPAVGALPSKEVSLWLCAPKLFFRLVRAGQKVPSGTTCTVGRDMKALIRSYSGTLERLLIILVLSISANAQQTQQADTTRLHAYDMNRESFLLGTVVKFESASSTPPIGAHVILQTSSGQVDVHLGNAKVLQAGHLELNAGDNVRIVGEPLALGDNTYFAARIVQKGAQAVAVRNAKGYLLTSASTLTPDQKQALRGVR